MGKSRRLAVVHVTDHFLCKWLTWGSGAWVKFEGIPKNANPYRVYYDEMRACFGIIFESSEFQEVQEGKEIPVIKMKITVVQCKKPEEVEETLL
jgi:hypothetical protein